jgi:hypothetical protein
MSAVEQLTKYGPISKSNAARILKMPKALTQTPGKAFIVADRPLTAW